MDLLAEGQKREIAEEEIEQFCAEFSIPKWFYTSAKTGQNIEATMDYLVGMIFEKFGPV